MRFAEGAYCATRRYQRRPLASFNSSRPLASVSVMRLGSPSLVRLRTLQGRCHDPPRLMSQEH